MAFAADVPTLRGIVGTTDADDDQLTHDLTVAGDLLTQYLGTVASDIPTEVYTDAVLAVAVERFNQRKAPSGIMSSAFTGPDGGAVPVRISRDPLAPAYPILALWISGKGYVA